MVTILERLAFRQLVEVDSSRVKVLEGGAPGSDQLELLAQLFAPASILNVILTVESDRRTAGMWQAKSKPQAIVIYERLKKVRFH